MRALAKLGDWTGSGPISSNTLAQLTAGNAGDGEDFAAAIALPHLWLDPLGPLLKNLPVLAAVLCLGAVSDQR